MIKLISFSLSCLLAVALAGDRVSAAWDTDDQAVLDGVQSLHERIFAPIAGQELSLDETMDLLQNSNELFEDEIDDEEMGEKQNDLGWLKTLSLDKNNCNTEWIGMIELSENAMPKSAHLKEIIQELTQKQLALCLGVTGQRIKEVREDSSAFRGALDDISALVEAVKQHANGAPLIGDLSDVKLAVAEGFVDYLEHSVRNSMDKLPETPISDHLKLVVEAAGENLEPSCRAMFEKFGEPYGFFRRMMSIDENIQAEPELIGWYEGLNLCKKIFGARVQNLFLIAKYDPTEVANKLKATSNKSEQDDLLDIYRLVALARKSILNEDVKDIQVGIPQSRVNSIAVGA